MKVPFACKWHFEKVLREFKQYYAEKNSMSSMQATLKSRGSDIANKKSVFLLILQMRFSNGQGNWCDLGRELLWRTPSCN